MSKPKTETENRPWGMFETFAKNTPCTVKIITVNAGESTSLQRHKERDEFWYVISGEGKVVVGDDEINAEPKMTFFVPKNTKHRIEGGVVSFQLLEVSFGEFDEKDIERIEDKYGRAVNQT